MLIILCNRINRIAIHYVENDQTLQKQRCHVDLQVFLFFFYSFLNCSTVQCGPPPPSCSSFSQLCFWILFSEFVILHLLIPVRTQFHHLFFGRTSLTIIVKYLTYFSLSTHSVKMTNPVQPTYSDKWKYI
jgi:hypothetical protein